MFYAFRQLWRRPGSTLFTVIALAVGIGSFVAIWQLVDHLLLRPLPVAEPDRLVAIHGTDRSNDGTGGYRFFPVSHPNFEDLERSAAPFSGLAAIGYFRANLVLGGIPDRALGQIVSGSYFDLLGLHPAIGRTFLPEESEVAGAPQVVVISHGLWRRAFHLDPSVIGLEIEINRQPFTVIGVAPPGFAGTDLLSATEFWVPMGVHRQVLSYDDLFAQRRWRLFQVVGRLADGADLREARGALRVVARRLEAEFPEDNRGRGLDAIPLTQAAVDPNSRTTVVRAAGLLLGTAGLLLLVACGNASLLLLAHVLERRRDHGVQIVFGASPRTLGWQILAESGLLAIAGGAAGVALAQVGARLLWQLRPPFVSDVVFDPSPDVRAVTLAFTIALVSCWLIALIPIVQIRRSTASLAWTVPPDESRSFAGRLQSALLSVQVAVSTVALIGAALFGASMVRSRTTDPGFDIERLLVVSVDLQANGYGESSGRALHRILLERVRDLPGAEGAALAESPPLFKYGVLRSVLIPGRVDGAEAGAVLVPSNTVTPGYLEAAGIERIAGRSFTEHDRLGGTPAALINETMAERYWPDSDPVGRRVRLAGEPGELTIVGVVQNAKYLSVTETPTPYLYLSANQRWIPQAHLLVRTEEPASLAPRVRDVFTVLDPTLPTRRMETGREILDRSLWGWRTGAGLLGAFGLVGLFLSTVGVYGVVANATARRRRELAMRIALGGRRGSIVALVVRRTFFLTMVGVGIGIAAGLAAVRPMTALLYGVRPWEPSVLAGVAVLLLAVAGLASILPAGLATRLDPASVLKES